MDAYWATSVKKWDVAAGLLIVSEAGGTISNLQGEALDLERPRFVAAGQDTLRVELIEILNAE